MKEVYRSRVSQNRPFHSFRCHLGFFLGGGGCGKNYRNKMENCSTFNPCISAIMHWTFTKLKLKCLVKVEYVPQKLEVEVKAFCTMSVTKM